MSAGNYAKPRGAAAGANAGHNAANRGAPHSRNKFHCFGCKRDLTVNDFSQSQLRKRSEFNPYVKGSGRQKEHHLVCKKCTPRQQTHLTCMLCNQTMVLDKFAKAQRREAERARCLKCMKERDAEEPDDDEFSGDGTDDDEESEYEEYDD